MVQNSQMVKLILSNSYPTTDVSFIRLSFPAFCLLPLSKITTLTTLQSSRTSPAAKEDRRIFVKAPAISTPFLCPNLKKSPTNVLQRCCLAHSSCESGITQNMGDRWSVLEGRRARFYAVSKNNWITVLFENPLFVCQIKT